MVGRRACLVRRAEELCLQKGHEMEEPLLVGGEVEPRLRKAQQERGRSDPSEPEQLGAENCHASETLRLPKL